MNLRVLLIIFTLFTLFLPLSVAPLFDLDEGAFSEATREMLRGENYITTYLDGNLRFDKPILIYWLQAFSVKIFGLNEFALRLPSALAGSLWALFIYKFTEYKFDKKSAYYATIFMLSSLQINLITKAAIADSLLNLFIATSIFTIYIYIEERGKKYLYYTYTLIALGVLTKGPVAIMVPLVTVAIYLSIKKEFKLLFSTIFNPIGIAIFIAIASPWYILEYLEQGEKFIDGFFFKHNLERFSTALESHKGSYFYYIPVILIGFLPFTTILLSTIKDITKYFKSNLELLLIVWFIFVVVFFSFSGTKLPHYIIYGYTPLFILMGLNASSLKNINISLIAPIVVLYIILFLLPVIVNFIDIKNLYVKELLLYAKEIFNTTYMLYIMLVTLLTIAIKYIKVTIELKIVLIATIFSFTINFIVISNYGKVAQLPIKEAAIIAKDRGLNVSLFHFTKPSFLVYLDAISIKTEPNVGSILLTKKSSLKNIDNYRVIYSKGGVYLIEVTKKIECNKM